MYFTKTSEAFFSLGFNYTGGGRDDQGLGFGSEE